MKKRMESDLLLKIISVVFAFLLWMFVINTDNPVIKKTFSDVPVGVTVRTARTIPAQTESSLPSVPAASAPTEKSTAAPAEAATQPPTEPGPLDLNRATAQELTTLPGIGEVLAQRIVDYREAHGPFRSVEELIAVEGIGEGKLEKLRELVTVEVEP